MDLKNATIAVEIEGLRVKITGSDGGVVLNVSAEEYSFEGDISTLGREIEGFITKAISGKNREES